MSPNIILFVKFVSVTLQMRIANFHENSYFHFLLLKGKLEISKIMVILVYTCSCKVKVMNGICMELNINSSKCVGLPKCFTCLPLIGFLGQRRHNDPFNSHSGQKWPGNFDEISEAKPKL